MLFRRGKVLRSPLADRNERNVTGHRTSKTTKTTGEEEGTKEESEKERRKERDFAVKKKRDDEKKTTTSKTNTTTSASASVCPDIIREYRETTSTRSSTKWDSNRLEVLDLEEEEALKAKISTSARTKIRTRK